MSQYQPNVAPGKSFISKINSKFSSLSISNTIQNNHSDKDGDTPDDTLIHNAFVKYFDQNNLPYPEWLGVKNVDPQARQQTQAYNRPTTQSNSQYQPVRTNYNTSNYQQQQQQQQQRFQPQVQPQAQHSPSSHSQSSHQQQDAQEVGRKPSNYTPRSSSRLLDLHNKSRQQAIPGSGYNAQVAPSRSNTTNTSAHSSRLRERMMNSSPSMNNLNQASQAGSASSSSNSGSGRATWGRKS